MQEEIEHMSGSGFSGGDLYQYSEKPYFHPFKR